MSLKVLECQASKSVNRDTCPRLTTQDRPICATFYSCDSMRYPAVGRLQGGLLEEAAVADAKNDDGARLEVAHVLASVAFKNGTPSSQRGDRGVAQTSYPPFFFPQRLTPNP